MQSDLAIEVMLFIANIGQFIYWSRDHHRLIDKLMSRNYAEYAQTNGYKGPIPRPGLVEASAEQAIEDKVLQELNGMFKA